MSVLKRNRTLIFSNKSHDFCHSEKNGHLSMEHTHPPHTNILTENRYKVVKNLKERINEIIS